MQRRLVLWVPVDRPGEHSHQEMGGAATLLKRFSHSAQRPVKEGPATRAYAERRRSEAKTDREIRRCLKRYIARQLFKQLEHTT